MAEYLLIESRDPFEYASVPSYYRLAGDLARAGNRVTLLLVHNGMLAARLGARRSELAELADAGVAVLADEFSLKERAIAVQDLLQGVKPTALDIVIDKMAAGCKTMWH